MRLDDLQAKLAASTNAEGKPIKGYGARVVALKAEITALGGAVPDLQETEIAERLTGDPETA